MKKGRLIVIEGIDGSGKTLQAKLLVKRLRREGFKVRAMKFPQYGKSYWSDQLIVPYLNGKFGSDVEEDAYLSSLGYALEREEYKGKIRKWIEEGYMVVCDRYADSNKIHQMSKLKTRRGKDKFEKWIATLEYKMFGIPYPDTVIYLEMGLKTAFMLSKGRDRKYMDGQDTDIHESDIKHLRNARNEGLRLCKKYANWIKIDSMRNGNLLPKEEISDKIFGSLTSTFKPRTKSQV